MADADAIVIGAGPAGLASAACLGKQGLRTLLLERADDVAASWRRHYDRLHLHTDKRRSALPYLPFPASYPRYPSRDQVVAYLEGYTSRFGIAPRFGQEVQRAERRSGSWHVRTSLDEFVAPCLVVATGQCRVPVVPKWPGLATFAGTIVHSSSYTSGARFRGQRVLVVGSGNSGAEIALDLHEQGARPSLAVRGPVTVVPRDPLGVPLLALAIPLDHLPPRIADTLTLSLTRLLLGDLRPWGLQTAPTGPFQQVARRGRVPLIDVGTIDLVRTGDLPLKSGIASFEQAAVNFSDGTREEYDAVVLAAGYRPDLEDFLTLPGPPRSDGSAAPLTHAERSSFAEQGLYLCGFDVVATGMLRQIALEARSLASQIADRHKSLAA